MSLKQPIFGRAMYADTALEAGQLVHITGDNSVSAITAGTDAIIGMATQNAEVGELSTIELFIKGIIELQTSGAVTAGVDVTGSEDGIKVASPGDTAFGVSLTSGTNAVITIAVK